MQPVRVRLALGREQIVALSCLCRQGERSVHRALGASWEAFRAFYGAERQSRVESCQQELLDLVGSAGAIPDRANRETVLARIRAPGVFRVLLGGWLARWKREWWFSPVEIGFTARVLQSLVATVEAAARPSQTSLIDLRMNLWACTYLIDCRCHGLPELQTARLHRAFPAVARHDTRTALRHLPRRFRGVARDKPTKDRLGS